MLLYLIVHKNVIEYIQINDTDLRLSLFRVANTGFHIKCVTHICGKTGGDTDSKMRPCWFLADAVTLLVFVTPDSENQKILDEINLFSINST